MRAGMKDMELSTAWYDWMFGVCGYAFGLACGLAFANST